MTLPFKCTSLGPLLWANSGRLLFGTESGQEIVLLFEEEPEYLEFMNIVGSLGHEPFVDNFLIFPNYQTVEKRLHGLLYSWPQNSILLSEFMGSQKVDINQLFGMVMSMTEAVNYLHNVCNVDTTNLNSHHIIVDQQLDAKCKLFNFSTTSNSNEYASSQRDLGNICLELLETCTLEDNKDLNLVEQLRHLINNNLFSTNYSTTGLIEFRQKLSLLHVLR
jgi:hypothetical protein